jgi:hypothetical protein
MAATPEEIDAVISKALTSPASVEVDGRKVVNRSAEDLLTLAGAAGGETAKANSVMHISRFPAGGSPVD